MSRETKMLLIIMVLTAPMTVDAKDAGVTITTGGRFTYTFTQQPEYLGIYEIAGITLCEDAEITIRRTGSVIDVEASCAISDLRIDFLVQNGSWIYRGKALLSEQQAIASTEDGQYNLIRTYPAYLGEFNIREAAVQQTPALDVWERLRQQLLIGKQYIFELLQNWRNL